MIEEVDLRLPQFWNKNDKAKYIDVGMNGYDLYYSGPGKKELDSATIRTNFPIRPQCGIYYFEIKVISKGEDGFICIGFCRAANKLERLPGWDAHSYAYHADDGHVFDQCGQGKEYGPSFSSGDIVGCCINYANKTAFFTKNGASLGIAFEDIDLSEPFYPCLGLRTPGEKVYVNFGQEPFTFDITQYIKEMKRRAMRELAHEKCPINDNDVDQLVLDYLIHNGYVETANALQRNTCYMKQNKESMTVWNNSTIQTRYNIRRSLLAGRVDEAISQIDIICPSLLQQNEHLLFQLKSQKFVEMINDSLHHTTNDLQHQVLYEDQTMKQRRPSLSTSHQTSVSSCASGRRVSWATIAASPAHPPTFERRSSNASSVHSLDCLDEEHIFIKRAMNYGQKLQDKYNSNPKYRTMLTDIFSLLAYPNPASSPMAYLLNKSARDSLASDINVAIQLYQHEQEVSSLEKIYKQAIVTIHQLSVSGHGKATLIQPNSI